MMHSTFEDAFDGVRSILVKKLAVSHGLLPELQDRGVMLPSQIATIMV